MVDLQGRAAGLLGIAVAGLLLTGCSAGSVAAAERAAPTSSAPASTASSAPMDADGSIPPLPSTAPAGARTPGDVAVATMTALTDHTVDAEGWIAALDPYLSPEARAAYAGTDPALVPAHRLVGAPATVAATAYLTTVAVGTDAGTYRVLESRAEDGHWQVERITPPERR